VDVANAAKLYGIYEGKAEAKIPVDRAYGIYNRQAPSPVTYAFNESRKLEKDYWQLRVYANAQSTAEAFLNLWVSTLGTTLTLAGGSVAERVIRFSDLPPTDQQLTDRYIFGRGALIEIASK
jgi:hypothetical protein